MRIRTKNRENLKVFEFWAFQKNLHMPSREKYIFHMLFRAFHDTPRSYTIHDVVNRFIRNFEIEIDSSMTSQFRGREPDRIPGKFIHLSFMPWSLAYDVRSWS